MTLAFDVFWSFRSPYSYLALHQLEALRRDWDVTINARPVLPIAVRIDGFFKKANPLWLPYLVRDTIRTAEFLGVPFKYPDPDPVVMDLKTGEVPKEQPHIHRLTRLAVLAGEQGHGFDFIREVGTMLWDGKTRPWNVGNHLAQAASRAGVDLAALDARQPAEAARLDGVIAENQKALEKAGHWGVPTMVLDGEPFFGQDRIDQLLFRLKQKGVKRR